MIKGVLSIQAGAGRTGPVVIIVDCSSLRVSIAAKVNEACPVVCMITNITYMQVFEGGL